ncbi:MAG: LacI family DNA-binding transcriptional regulator [Geminicoccaceae bacterium]
MTKNGRLTQRDVARTVGVSDMTVSRVLTGQGTVPKRTRERILAAVRECGYLPNRMAGSLSASRSNQVGVVLPSLTVGIFPEVASGVALELEKAGYNPVIGVTDYDALREERLVESMLSWNAAGMIVNDFVHAARTSQLLGAARVPTVEIMQVSGNPIHLCVGFNHAATARCLADHLLSKGYRRFGFLGWHGVCGFDEVRRDPRSPGRTRPAAQSARDVRLTAGCPGGQVRTFQAHRRGPRHRSGDIRQ